jgi:hypothetical protein
MNQADQVTLNNLRARIDSGEEFTPTLLARYQDLLAQEACEFGSKKATEGEDFIFAPFNVVIYLLSLFLLQKLSC